MRNLVEVSGPNPENLHKPKCAGDVGYDLATAHEVSFWAGVTYRFVKTGVKLHMPPGVWCEIVGRSSTLTQRGLLVVHSIIDTGYTGELTIGLINLTGQMVTVPKGQRLAQLIFRDTNTPALQLTTELPTTDRGENGFGHTGV